MSVRDSPSVITRRAINKLLKDLRDKLQPDKLTKEDNKYYEKIKKLKYKEMKDKWECDVLEGIPVEDFEKYIEELQERYSLPDKAKKSFLDVLISNEKHGSPNDFNLSENGEITMFSLEFITRRKNEKIDLVFAMYNLSFKIENEETSSNKKAFSMSDGKKHAFHKLYQEKLYNYVDKKCKEKAAEKTD
ncbi:Hypothetical predicted protein [Paramuricea clavata]|uniref:Uncharacterized protein n=1 Tax=Paramuricea clavata TaxID=317549 RepID=A0A6S7IV63_PARCT|nr:Hypothetical predicted protein [Paramuricea clavata]